MIFGVICCSSSANEELQRIFKFLFFDNPTGNVRSEISFPTISAQSVIIFDSLKPLSLKILSVIFKEIELIILGFVFLKYCII